LFSLSEHSGQQISLLNYRLKYPKLMYLTYFSLPEELSRPLTDPISQPFHHQFPPVPVAPGCQRTDQPHDSTVHHQQRKLIVRPQ